MDFLINECVVLIFNFIIIIIISYWSMASKVPNEPIEPYLDPLKFYNHGDNPAMKNFMKICMENVKDGKFIDHRSLVIDKGQRYSTFYADICWPETGTISCREPLEVSLSQEPLACSSWTHCSVFQLTGTAEACCLSESSESDPWLRPPCTTTSVSSELLEPWALDSWAFTPSTKLSSSPSTSSTDTFSKVREVGSWRRERTPRETATTTSRTTCWATRTDSTNQLPRSSPPVPRALGLPHSVELMERTNDP